MLAKASHLFFFMRLDIFLKLSRLVIRRSLAQKLCDAGVVAVNGATAKPSKEIRTGDEIEITWRTRSIKVIVEEIPKTKNVSKESAGGLYRTIEEKQIENELP